MSRVIQAVDPASQGSRSPDRQNPQFRHESPDRQDWNQFARPVHSMPVAKDGRSQPFPLLPQVPGIESAAENTHLPQKRPLALPVLQDTTGFDEKPQHARGIPLCLMVESPSKLGVPRSWSPRQGRLFMFHNVSEEHGLTDDGKTVAPF